MTDRYSGADTVELCEYSKMYAIEREIESKSDTSITMDDIRRAKEYVSSSVDDFDFNQMNEYRQQISK